MTDVETRSVAAEEWRTELTAARDAGWRYLDLLAVVDRIEQREVVVHLLDPVAGRRLLVTTRVPSSAPRLASLAEVFPAAAWHEREAAEMFGVVFDGHPDPRPLLLHGPVDRPPLLADVPLAARLTTPWPGAVEAGEGRRARRPVSPPGVRPTWVAEGSS